jgi:hypothetical protein
MAPRCGWGSNWRLQGDAFCHWPTGHFREKLQQYSSGSLAIGNLITTKQKGLSDYLKALFVLIGDVY